MQLTGQPKIGNVVINKDDGFNSESTIETDKVSSVMFMIPDLGRLFIDSSSIVSRTNSNEIKIDRGQIRNLRAMHLMF